MISKFFPIALVSLGALGASAYGTSQAPQYEGSQAPEYGGNQAPTYNAAPQQPGSANPGALNYVEGSVLLNGNQLSRQDVGRAYLQPGGILATTTGKAEILLTPGVFLRIDDNSAVKMVSPDLTKTQVEVEQGRAAVEVDQIFPQNDLEVVDAGVATQMLKPGFYEFSAGQPTALVFQGKAVIRESNGRTLDIKDHHEVKLVANAEEKSTGFDTRDAHVPNTWLKPTTRSPASTRASMASLPAGTGIPGCGTTPLSAPAPIGARSALGSIPRGAGTATTGEAATTADATTVAASEADSSADTKEASTEARSVASTAAVVAAVANS